MTPDTVRAPGGGAPWVHLSKEVLVVAPVAELVAVSHRYGRVAALTDVSLSLQPGQVTALLGPNGAG